MKKIFKENTKIVNGIINNSGENDESFGPRFVKKYRKQEDGRPLPGVVHQYIDIIKTLSINDEVVLDFGCSTGHASAVFKEKAPRATYIGADVSLAELLGAKNMYDPDFLYKIRYDEPCLGSMRANSVDLIVVSRLTDWNSLDNFFPEFNRVLKSGGCLFVYSNRGLTGGPRVEPKGWQVQRSNEELKIAIYNYLKDDYTFYYDKFTDLEGISRSLWGSKDKYKKLEAPLSEAELNKRFRGLFIKK